VDRCRVMVAGAPGYYHSSPTKVYGFQGAKAYTSFEAAESAARRHVSRNGYKRELWQIDPLCPSDYDAHLYLGTVVRDPLDRVWTDLSERGAKLI
jgi:hypothetical protein